MLIRFSSITVSLTANYTLDPLTLALSILFLFYLVVFLFIYLLNDPVTLGLYSFDLFSFIYLKNDPLTLAFSILFLLFLLVFFLFIKNKQTRKQTKKKKAFATLYCIRLTKTCHSIYILLLICWF